MGQSYIIINIDKSEYIDPLLLEDGTKLKEIVLNGTALQTLGVLLADPGTDWQDRSSNPMVGRWQGDRVVVVGDYATAGKYLPDGWREARDGLYRHEKDPGPTAYVWYQKCATDVTGSALMALVDDPIVRNMLEASVVACVHSFAAEAHAKLLASGYFSGLHLDPNDLSAFDL
jgi:hypothetical protein